MGLFGKKKEPCPVCGSEVKGLFLKKIGGKKTLCKECSKLICMPEEMQENASPEFVREHLEGRRKMADLYQELHWDVVCKDLPGTWMGFDLVKKYMYIMHSGFDNSFDVPVILGFDQIIGYELYRGKNKLDDMDNMEPISLETTFTFLKRFSSSTTQSNVDHFYIRLKTTDPYWPDMEIKLTFTADQLHGFTGFGKPLVIICNALKSMVRREGVILPESF